MHPCENHGEHSGKQTDKPLLNYYVRRNFLYKKGFSTSWDASFITQFSGQLSRKRLLLRYKCILNDKAHEADKFLWESIGWAREYC
jgi:hypothetical protein